MTRADALDLYRRAVSHEAELKALLAARPENRWAAIWRDMLPSATELVAATREALERAA